MFACEHFDIVPDILVIGKGLGGGIMPFAAMIAREELNVMVDRALGHYTHEKNPVAAAAALATIDVIETEGVLTNVCAQGEYALQRLQAMKEKHPLIGDVRGLGLMIGVELVTNRASKERAVNEAEQVMYHSLANGLNFKLTMGNIVTLTPALTITRPEMDRALDILEAAIRHVSSPRSAA
jgi:4-aminobutyrate aminotransferase